MIGRPGGGCFKKPFRSGKHASQSLTGLIRNAGASFHPPPTFPNQMPHASAASGESRFRSTVLAYALFVSFPIDLRLETTHLPLTEKPRHSAMSAS